ncbi:hypothetical protein [Nonomuraea longicatena]|uniref:Transposase n=1 Tax=Nonomuraea longicatena TaxID=83682 RepID=A0ABN1P3C4_9ACTN
MPESRRGRVFAEEVESHFGFLRARFGFEGPRAEPYALVFLRPDLKVEVMRDSRTQDVFTLLWRRRTPQDPAREADRPSWSRGWDREDLEEVAAELLPSGTAAHSVSGRTRYAMNRSLAQQAEVLTRLLELLVT